MADEIRVVPEHAETDDPDAARAEIAHTRARMSGTIDEIEDALLRRKERMQHRLDPFSTVRERPLQAAGIVFGAGLVLGLLTGGDDDDDLDDDEVDYDYDVDVDLELDQDRTGFRGESRTKRWEDRARRMAHRTRESVGAMHLGTDTFHDDDDDAWDDDDGGSGVFGGLRDVIADRLAPVIGDVVRRMIRGNRAS